MTAMGRVRITGDRSDGKRLRGQDLKIRLVTKDGTSHPLPATLLHVICNGRHDDVKALVLLQVHELDAELDAEIVKEKKS